MMGKFFSKRNKSGFYLPGQEIKIDKANSFQGFSCETDSLSVCKNRVIFSVMCFALAYLAVSLRLFDLCILPRFAKDEAAPRKVAVERIIRRADILDRNGTIIATSLPTVDLQVDPKKVFDAQKLARDLVKILPDLNYAKTYEQLASGVHTRVIKRNLTPSQQYQINYLGEPSLEFKAGEKRVYPHKNLFAHIVGKTDIDNNGISGLEKELDERLVKSDIPLTLSIDVGIQDSVRELLYDSMKEYRAIGATAVLMDVNTAEIISLVSLPDYDPNLSINANAKENFNMATKGVYEPGSVLKVFNTAMSLESGKVKVADKFDATQPLKLKYNTIKDYRGENRWLSVPEILIHSSNIGSAQMALKVGGNEQRQFLEKIGFFESLDIELAEKGRPQVPSRWGDGTIASVAYGYGISVSPLHVISAYSSVVNGGIYHSPSLLKNSPKAQNGHRVLSFATSKAMRKLMRLVVTEGSGKRANITGYEVGGKTGTAQKVSEGGYNGNKRRTTFLSAFPISNPKYALIVMFDEPKAREGDWGFATAGWNAVPASAKIIKTVAPQLNLPANYDLEEERNARIIEASFGR